MNEEREYRPRASSEEDEGERGGRGAYIRVVKVCQFCVEKITVIDYKQTELLRKYMNESGKIRPRRQTGACARHQRLVATAIKRSRHLALLPYTGAKP